jgi:pilus assembly protein Flp/PilA
MPNWSDFLGSDDVHPLPHWSRSGMITSYEFLATWLRARFDDERGASLVEYALLVGLIAVVCVSAITVVGNSTSAQFSNVGQSLAAN